MASYTIGVTAFEYSEADNVENPENAYDSSASTYATVDMYSEDEHVYLYSFNFSKIPQGEVVTSITAKVKLWGSCDLGDCLVWLQSTADGAGVKLSADMTPDTSVSTKTLSLTADIATIMSYASTLSVAFSHDGVGATFNIYAVYFTVETSVVKPNKVIYGNETLIDLTGDTATTSDVAIGKTFHLASGLQAIGEYVPSVGKKTATPSSTSSTSLAFTGLTKAPSFFVALPSSSLDMSFSSARVICFLYNGETTYRIYGSYSNGAASAKIMATSASFTYSSGTLTIKSSGTAYFLRTGWNLFYI